MTMEITSDDADQEMADVDPATGSHLASGAKRKGRSVSHGAKKRAHPPPSPRTSSAGAKARSPPAKKIASSNKMPRSASPQGKVAGKPPVKPSPQGNHSAECSCSCEATAKECHRCCRCSREGGQGKSSSCREASQGQGGKGGKSSGRLGESEGDSGRERAPCSSCSAVTAIVHHRIGQRSPLARSSSGRQLRLTALIRTVQKDSITTLHPTTTSAATGVSLTPSLTHR